MSRQTAAWLMLATLAGALVPFAAGADNTALLGIDERPEPNIEAGAELYRTRCAVCHGADGAGDGPAARHVDPPPRDFTTGEYRYRWAEGGLQPIEADLYQTISLGVPGAGMPGWSGLTIEERWQLVYFVRSLAPVLEETIDAASGGPDRGAILVQQLGCYGCHGPNGSGGLPNVNSQLGVIPNLTGLGERLGLADPEAAQIASRLLAEGEALESLNATPPFEGYGEFVDRLGLIRATIREGRSPAPVDPAGPSPMAMPPWGSVMDAADIDAVIAHLIGLQE